ncbi:MAG: N-acetylmuramoyl-L-alanine amidase [Chloroflexia bacterium]|nr:N-acetylmuramoyl-L-alanine amidase [Chloroflexia bacterium]
MNVYNVQDEFQGGFADVRGATRYLVVHHAAALYPSDSGIDDVRIVASYHINGRRWPGIGYHICLAEEYQGGPIARYNVSDLNLQRAHVAWRNHEAIGICCLTDFGSKPPEEKWIAALTEVLRELKQLYPQAEIVGHRDIAYDAASSPDGKSWSTSCPGARWPEWKGELLARVAGGFPPPLERITPYTTLISQPRVTPVQCTRYILSRPHGDYSSYAVSAIIVPVYFRVGEIAGIDPLLAMAQMIHETGNLTSWWSQRPRRNPAGIGVTGASIAQDLGDPLHWAWNEDRQVYYAGLSFDSWAEYSIPAHIGRLLAYAMPLESPLTAEQQDLLDYALSVRPLPNDLRGCAPTLNGLVGTWASPGKQVIDGQVVTYADRLSDIANRILAE